MITDNKIWPKCLDKLSESISEKEMRMWIKPLKVEHVGENLKLYAPNKFMKEEVEKNFLSKINSVLSNIIGTANITLDVIRTGVDTKTGDGTGFLGL